MASMIYIGVDPGKKGAMAMLYVNGNGGVEPNVSSWSDEGFVTWASGIRAVARENKEYICAAVEKVGARPGQGTVSMFSFGQSYGFILGVLAALGIGYQLVSPSAWKREFGLLNADKRQSVSVCKRLFPGVNLLPSEKCSKESDGMAEALLIAEYARRKM